MGDVSSVFKFVSGSVSYDTGDVFLVKLDPNINNTDDLFNSLYYTLWFPGYFGFNWNAQWKTVSVILNGLTKIIWL